MKRVILVSAMIVSAATASLAAVTDSNSASQPQFSHAPVQVRQIIDRELRRKHHRNNRETYETRIVWRGNKEYRDTYRITWKNGRRHEKRVNRVRIN